MSSLVPYIQKIDVETHIAKIHLVFDTSFVPVSLKYHLYPPDISKNIAYETPFFVDGLNNGDTYSISVAATYPDGTTTAFSEPATFIPYDLSAISSPLVIPIDLSFSNDTFLMAASNSPETSSLNSNTVNIIFVPQQPIITAIEPSNSCIIIHLDKSNQYYTSLNYVYDVNGTSQKYILDNSLSFITIPHLRNGARYKIKLHAFKDEYSGKSVETGYFIPYGNPFPPIIQSAYYEGTQLNVKLKPAYNGGNGFPTKSYLWSINSTENFTDISFLSQTLVQYPDLITEPAILRMKSVNAAGLVSLNYAEYLIRFQPSKPIIDKIVAGDSCMRVYLKNGVDTGDMQYRFSFNGGSQQMCQVVDTSCLLISRLQNGLAHKVRIIKYNGLFSLPSDESGWIGIGLAPNKLIVKDAANIADEHGKGIKIRADAEIEGANNGIQIHGYKYRIDNGAFTDIGFSENGVFIIRGILPGKHTCQITAYNNYGECRPSQLKYISVHQ